MSTKRPPSATCESIQSSVCPAARIASARPIPLRLAILRSDGRSADPSETSPWLLLRGCGPAERRALSSGVKLKYDRAGAILEAAIALDSWSITSLCLSPVTCTSAAVLGCSSPILLTTSTAALGLSATIRLAISRPSNSSDANRETLITKFEIDHARTIAEFPDLETRVNSCLPNMTWPRMLCSARAWSSSEISSASMRSCWRKKSAPLTSPPSMSAWRSSLSSGVSTPLKNIYTKTLWASC